MMRSMVMTTMLLAGLRGARAQSFCAGDVCVGNSMLNPNAANWAKTPFDKCPTATNGDCDLAPSTIYRETRCELGTRARTSGLADWMPVEFPQTDAALGGILTYKEDDMTFSAPQANIILDGDLHDWLCAPIKAQTPFYPFNKAEAPGIPPVYPASAAGSHCCGDELTMFDDRDTNVWNALDHSTAISFAWDTEAFYIGVKVVDDSHENKGSGWNGDSVQIAFTDAGKQRITNLYNYAWTAGETILHHERGHPDEAPSTEAFIVREGTITTYEIKIPAMALRDATGSYGVLQQGHSFGVGVAVNDGDVGANGEDIGEGGQNGWSGWGPYTVVHDKVPSQAGLVTLQATAPERCPVQECRALGAPPTAQRECAATAACSAADGFHWAKGKVECPTGCGLPAQDLSRPAVCQLGGHSGLERWMPRELEQTDAAYSSRDVVYKPDNMKFDVPHAIIQLDGDLAEWKCAEVKAQTPFYPYNDKANGEGSHCCGNRLTMFDDYGGKVAWDPGDQSVAMSFAWDPGNFYIGIKVIDDSHENVASSGWNGDSVQIAFTNEQRDSISHLYNFALTGAGDIVAHKEQGHVGTREPQAMITRHPSLPITTYEISIPAESLQSVTGMNSFRSDHKFGVGVAVNDGDIGVNGEDIGEGGQQGWSGWGPYTVVYGKNPQQAGLVTLKPNPPMECATDADCIGAEGVAEKPVASEHCPATRQCEIGDAGDGWTWVLVILLIAAGVAVWKFWPLIVTKIPAGIAEKLPKGGGGIESGLGSSDPPAASGDSIYG